MLKTLALILAATTLSAPALAGAPRLPRFDHVIVIVEENKSFEQLSDPALTPNFVRLAKTYGVANRFYGEVHPSEANYVALLGGDTFGIHDDDAFYCHAGMATDPNCPFSGQAGYPDHTVHGPHLGDQLAAKGLTWKGYFEDLPAPGSLAVTAAPAGFPAGPKAAVYASKHSGFVNFEDVQKDPRRADHLQGFDAFHADLAADRLPSFALLIPNQCNEMHGLHMPGVPEDCDQAHLPALIARGDAQLGKLVAEIQASRAWKAKGNFAIVVTFDEDTGKTRDGCCAVTPDAPSNFGGGHIPTIVVTNHGPRGLADETPYNHDSMLRTFEDVFGIDQHLGHAADAAKGVVSMTRLFGGK
jgi:hypothetical protein